MLSITHRQLEEHLRYNLEKDRETCELLSH